MSLIYDQFTGQPIGQIETVNSHTTREGLVIYILYAWCSGEVSINFSKGIPLLKDIERFWEHRTNPTAFKAVSDTQDALVTIGIVEDGWEKSVMFTDSEFWVAVKKCKGA